MSAWFGVVSSRPAHRGRFFLDNLGARRVDDDTPSLRDGDVGHVEDMDNDCLLCRGAGIYTPGGPDVVRNNDQRRRMTADLNGVFQHATRWPKRLEDSARLSSYVPASVALQHLWFPVK